jgi:hypothetical protein
MNGLRVARVVSTAAVASIAAWSSYFHMTTVGLHFGERPEVAYVLPLSVDGMLVVASGCMVDDKANGRKIRWSARLAFAVGVAASVGANVAAAHPSVGARIVAGWPALALLLVVEMLTRSGKTEVAEVPEPPEPEVPAVPESETPAASSSWATTSEPEVPASVTKPRRRTAGPRTRWSTHELAAAAVELMRQKPEMKRAEVAAQLGVGDRRLRQVLADA